MPKAAFDQNGHDLMEAIFGKRIMREVDTLLEDENPESCGPKHRDERLP